jgi:hypothetical protein
MKRFLVFAGDSHYPAGGIEDLVGDADTMEEAEALLEELEEWWGKRDWSHIVDTSAGVVGNIEALRAQRLARNVRVAQKCFADAQDTPHEWTLDEVRDIAVEHVNACLNGTQLSARADAGVTAGKNGKTKCNVWVSFVDGGSAFATVSLSEIPPLRVSGLATIHHSLASLITRAQAYQPLWSVTA